MKAASYFQHIFGDKSSWVNSVDIPVKNHFVRLALILYGLSVANTKIEFGRLISDLVDANQNAIEAGKKNMQGVWGLPDGHFIILPLVTILSDDLGSDAPLSALNVLKIGKGYLATRYLSEFGSSSIGNEPKESTVTVLSGDHIRDLVNLFK
jgi:hypothetical protein